MRRHPFVVSFVLVLAISTIETAADTAWAACGTPGCGHPVTDGPVPTATDCVFILRGAVGLQTCNPCYCDVDSSGSVSATDASKCLQRAVGIPVPLNCPPCAEDSVPPPSCDVFEIITGAGSSLDAGWNGAGHDANIVEGASVFVGVVRRCGGDGDVCLVDAECNDETCDLTCDCDCPAESDCEIAGPVGDKRCLVSMNLVCDGDDSCPGSETCEKFFGPPLPLVAEGTPTCVTTYFQEDLVGTANLATGDIEASARLRSRVHLGIQLAKPCPRCGSLAQTPEVGDVFTCDGGRRNTQPCTVDAVSPEFGGTSLDCPPDPTANVSGVGLAIDFESISTGTRARDAVIPCGGSLAALHPSNGGAVCVDTFEPCTSNTDCMRCTEDPTTDCANNSDCNGKGSCAPAPEQPIACGVYCHCGFCDGDPDLPCSADSDCGNGEHCIQGTGVSQQLQPNKCADLTCGLGGLEECCSNDDPSCANPTPKLGKCTLQAFRVCADNADCASDDAGTCTLADRPCFENRIERAGTPSPLGSYCVDDPDVATCDSNDDCALGECRGNSAEPTTVALFCIPATASGSINAAGGISGPGTVTFKASVLGYRCSDGIQSGIEQCDDGNNANGDGCDEICRSE